MRESGRILCIDSGNSACKFAVFDAAGEVKHAIAFRHSLGAELSRVIADSGPVSNVVVACPLRDSDEIGQLLLHHALGAPVHFLTADSPLPFTIGYTGGRPGADRLANVMALRALSPRTAAVVADFGTATNMEAIDSHGNFLGGVIMPGILTGAEALHRATEQSLPLVSMGNSPDPIDALSRSSVGAIQSGIVLGQAGAVERIFADIAARQAGTSLFVTGGFRRHVLPHLKVPAREVPHLTLLGLREYARYLQSLPPV